jgi:hypothetical protein
MTKADKKKYPTASTRVSFEWQKRFNDLLQFVRRNHPTMEAPVLLRLLLGADTRVDVEEGWREYLSGKIEVLEKETKRRFAK